MKPFATIPDGFNLQTLMNCTWRDVIHLVSFYRKQPHKDGYAGRAGVAHF